MDHIHKHRKNIALNIVKALDSNTFDRLEKARSGIYADTPQNRKLGRVGKKYGNKKQSADDNYAADYQRLQDKFAEGKLTEQQFDVQVGRFKQAAFADIYQRALSAGKSEVEAEKIARKRVNSIVDGSNSAPTASQFYEKINKKYGTKLKSGDIEEFDDDAMRNELTEDDIESVLKDEAIDQFEANIKRASEFLDDDDIEDLNFILTNYKEGRLNSARSRANLVETIVREEIPPFIYNQITTAQVKT